MRTPRVSQFVHEHPWAVLPDRLETLLAILDRHAAGEPMAADVQAAIQAARRPALATGAGARVIQVVGMLFPRANLMTETSGATSLETFTRTIRGLAADPAVSAIILDIDSPGGSVFGVEEAAQAIVAARSRKTVTAIANPCAASAAYWLASQASELIVVPGGQVGSIGVVAVHDDLSKAAEHAGVARSFIHAGKYKVEGHEYGPLEAQARAAIQTEVDAYYDAFVRAVAAGRKVTPHAVRAGFGEGRMVRSGPAVAAGMADRVGTLDATVARLTAAPGRGLMASAPARRAPDADTERRRRAAELAARGIHLPGRP